MDDAARRKALDRTVRRGSRPGALARACLLVAAAEHPHLDPSTPVAEIRRMAKRVAELRAASGGKLPAAQALAEVLGREEGFGGAGGEYDDPENSFLHRVIERRRGLPILLSVVWIEVARAAGIGARGVPFPGHFAVYVEPESGEDDDGVYVDPFGRGRELSGDEVLRLCMGPGGATAVSPAWLRRTSARQTILRVLANLARSYEARGDLERLERTVSDQIALAPGDPMLVVRRAEVLVRSDRRAAALADYRRALAALPAGAVFARVHDQARQLARLGISVN
ncbi:MAG: hypothetical protein HMLKMBBP_01457 [Planctomycetes bacterium]|nr:hypothetical protein [Planctomycetota bacterium]